MKAVNRIFKCSCWGEAVEIDYDPGDKLVSMCMWKLGLSGRPRSFIDRLRWCWKTLTTGDCWTDEVLLTPNVAMELGKELFNVGLTAGSEKVIDDD